MKLKEYVDKVDAILNQYEATGKVLAEAAHRNSHHEISDKYVSAVSYVQRALEENIELLNIVKATNPPQTREVLLETEIPQKDLERHLLKVRFSLRDYAPEVELKEKEDTENPKPLERIIFNIVVELSGALGGKKLGKVFGDQELQLYAREFGGKAKLAAPEDEAEEKPKPTPKPAPASAPPPAPKPAQAAPPAPAPAPAPAPVPARLWAPEPLPQPPMSPGELERLAAAAIGERNKAAQVKLEVQEEMNRLEARLRAKGQIQ